MLSIIPWAGCGALAFLFAIDAPYWDEWAYVPLVTSAFDGTLKPADLWFRVNEHVFLLPSAITVALARLTHWDMRYEIGFNILFFTLAFLVLARMVMRADSTAERRGTLWVVPLTAVLVFSFSQRAVWVWGLHLAVGLAVLLLMLALYILSSGTLRWPRVVFALACAIGASFSIGGGLAVWPAGAVLLALRPGLDRNRRLGLIGVWCLVAALTAWAYLTGGDAVPPETGERLRQPLVIVPYVLAFLGGPLAAYHGAAAVVFGVLLLAAVAWLLTDHRSTRADDNGMAVALMGALLVVGPTIAILAGLKHAHEGVAQAISSRLLPWPTLSWCGLLLGLYARCPRLGVMRRGGRILIGLVLAGGMASSFFGAYKAEERHDAFLLGRRALLEDPENGALIFLHPRPDEIRALRPILVQHRLTIFREATTDERIRPVDPPPD